LRDSWKLAELNGDFHHPCLKEPREEWIANNRELADKANHGDDAALIKLIERDPRYLACPVVIAKIMLWKMQVLRGRMSVPRKLSDKNANGIISDRGKGAGVRLRELGSAVQATEGKGLHRGINLRQLMSDYDWLTGRVEMAVRLLPISRAGRPPDEASITHIVAETGLDVEHIRALARAPDKKQGLVQQILATKYDLGVRQIRKRILEGQRSELPHWD